MPTQTADDDYLPAFCGKRVLVLGCGNRLFGDDGFGPAVIEYLLSHHEIPGDVYVMDAGTGVRKLLFTLTLSSERPQRIIIIDAVDQGRTPGEIFDVSPEGLPPEKLDDFSLHQVPSSNLVHELKKTGVDVRVVGCQTEAVPQRVKPGLSARVRIAVQVMGERIAKEIQSYANMDAADRSPG